MEKKCGSCQIEYEHKCNPANYMACKLQGFRGYVSKGQSLKKQVRCQICNETMPPCCEKDDYCEICVDTIESIGFFERLENQVIEWGKEKEIIGKATVRDQLLKTVEELGELTKAITDGYDTYGQVLKTIDKLHEITLNLSYDSGGNISFDSDPSYLLGTLKKLGRLAGAVLKGNDEDAIDGFGDVLVTLILAHHHFSSGKTSIVSCLQSAYDEIKDRTGRIENGNFIKDS